MDFTDRLNNLVTKAKSQKGQLETEEATKNAFVMPFINSVLGYDVFNPSEVIPEFTADVGTKRNEKVDYAIAREGRIVALIECKHCGSELNSKHASQLFRYFSVTEARLAILTNGIRYQFFTDLDAPNKMDERPFLELNLEELNEAIVPELKRLTKDAFDIDAMLSCAGELKYTGAIKKLISAEFKSPSEELVKHFASQVYDGKLMPAVRQQFEELTKKAMKLFLNEEINTRLKSAMATEDVVEEIILDNPEKAKPDIVTTEEELEGFYIVKSILRSHVDLQRLAARDTKSYFGILLDDNNRKPICRLHFNRNQKYLGVFDENKIEERIPLTSLDDIFDHAERLVSTVGYY
ncbi:type I restriction endonuclease [Gallaecimonas sp. GXIMD4217]|uniref:type I restriction endonuclease n=1 Tax=Gallaecimonas sp. GXIMD4217 TaxID=3131927 RepID=UPI00311ADE9B